MNEAMNLPNPGRVVASGVDRITDPSYPVDAALRQWVSNVPAFQPTLGGMLQKTGTKLLDTGTEFVTALQNGDYEAAINSPIFPMGGMTVFHGSPHKFDAFDLSKIGTGEGAQAYGHGLYFAESPGVAKSYQKALGHKDVVKQFRSELPDDIGVDEIVEALYRGELPPKVAGVVKALKDDDWLGFDYPSQAISAAFKNIDEFDPSPALRSAIKEYGGNLYHVDIPDEQIAKMLDWDKPLSEQPESVKSLLRGSDIAPDESVWSQYTGQQLYEGEMQAGGPYKGSGWASSEAQKAVSEKLRKIGIPGIKYLDGGSRGAGEGTRNLVLFDDKLAKVLKRE
jgi:hypothetical protein